MSLWIKCDGCGIMKESAYNDDTSPMEKVIFAGEPHDLRFDLCEDCARRALRSIYNKRADGGPFDGGLKF